MIRVLRIEPIASAADEAAIHALLSAAQLPVEDLAIPGERFFQVARDETGIVGAIGLERHGTHGLLRSLVVVPHARAHGTGTALVQALERDARDRGIGELLLLTQTAQPFFARLGYAVIERTGAPAAVQASAEFRSLCPASAVCMRKTLI